MAQEFSGQTADGTADVVRRVGGKVTSGLLQYKKTGTGTCTIKVIDEYTGAEVNSDVSIDLAANAQQGTVEFPLPPECKLDQSSTTGSVSVDARIDGAGS